MRKHNFQSAISLHSGVEVILTPWSYDQNEYCPDWEEYTKLGYTLQGLTSYPYATLYPCCGEWGDWMYAARGIIALTIEVYGNYYTENIWDYFNPPANEVIDISENQVYPGLLYMLEYDQPDLNIIPYEPPVGFKPISNKLEIKIINSVTSVFVFLISLIIIRKKAIKMWD